MKRLIIVLLMVLFTSGVALASGGKNRGTTGTGTTSTGNGAQGSASQDRSGR